MESLREIRCVRCGKQLFVPADAQLVRCSTCRSIIKIQNLPCLFRRGGVLGPRPQYSEFDGVPEAIPGNGLFADWPRTGPYTNVFPMGLEYGGQGRHYGEYGTRPLGTGPYGLAHLDPAYGPRPQVNEYMPAVAPAGAFGRKRAVLCGVNYKNMSDTFRLKGSIYDVKSMRSFLIRWGFPPDSILMLTEEGGNPDLMPTKKNIRRAMRWLVQGSQPEDSLVFHFSGHGSNQKDYSGDEPDGEDEALCPLDHETEGKIIDDEINGTLVRPLPPGATLHAIIDACYSGTVLDLPRVCRMNREGYYYWEDHCPRHVYKGTSGGLAVCFSACDDGHTSGDTSAFTGTSTGAMTYSFIKAAASEPEPTYGRLLNLMRSAIRHAKSDVKGGFYHSNISEEPQLSSSEEFDVYSRKFIL